MYLASSTLLRNAARASDPLTIGARSSTDRGTSDKELTPGPTPQPTQSFPRGLPRDTNVAFGAESAPKATFVTSPSPPPRNRPTTTNTTETRAPHQRTRPDPTLPRSTAKNTAEMTLSRHPSRLDKVISAVVTIKTRGGPRPAKN
ncbi:hypothetical protein GCM10027199_70070 [Amycolatopsis magusensis]